MSSAIKLISATPKAEELISYCARVSNPSNQDNPESEKLIKYLIKHKHWSPFELAHVVMEINTTRAIAAQILRHRSFSFQEFSQRYADVSLMDFARPPHLRKRSRLRTYPLCREGVVAGDDSRYRRKSRGPCTRNPSCSSL